MRPPRRFIRNTVVLAGILSALLCAGCGAPPADKGTPWDLRAEQIRQDTEYLCDTIGVRVTGTAGEIAACDWIMETLEDAGFSPDAGGQGQCRRGGGFAGDRPLSGAGKRRLPL